MKRLRTSSAQPRGRVKRRHYEQAFKRHLVELTLVPGASVARIALDHRLNANILFRWRRHYLRELTKASAEPAAGALLPVSVSNTYSALELLSESRPSARSGRKHELMAAGVIEIELASAQVRVTGNVELEVLRLVLEALSHQ